LQYTCRCNTRALAVHVLLQYTCSCSTRAVAVHVLLQYTCRCNTRALAVHVLLQYTCRCNTRALAVHVLLQCTCCCNLPNLTAFSAAVMRSKSIKARLIFKIKGIICCVCPSRSFTLFLRGFWKVIKGKIVE